MREDWSYSVGDEAGDVGALSNRIGRSEWGFGTNSI